MGRIISIFNQKGGVGKTTTVINLGSYLAEMGYRILLIDNDPQGNMSSGLGIEKNDTTASISTLFSGLENPENCIVSTSFKNIDIIKGSIELASIEIQLAGVENRESILANALPRISDNYDFIFIDCPPSLGLLSVNALAASDSVIIPIQCEFFALEGVSQLMYTYELVKERINPKLEIEGIVLSMFDGRTNLSIQVVEEVKRYFKGLVYVSIIPRNVKLAEAPSEGKPIIIYDPKSKGAESYKELAEEFIERYV